MNGPVLQAQVPRAPASARPTRLGASVVRELEPIIEAIAASLHDGRCAAQRTGKPVAAPQSPRPPRGLDARQLRLIDEAIDERLAETISVSMLSSIAGLSRSHFSHAFRRSVGSTPHAYVVRARIERAMNLMRGSNASLTEIALSTGFSDQAHFTNTFRRTAGTTPRAWRARYHDGGANP